MLLFFFFFQAEDGIRDLTVTGVQTCALPISLEHRAVADVVAAVGGCATYRTWYLVGHWVTPSVLHMLARLKRLRGCSCDDPLTKKLPERVELLGGNDLLRDILRTVCREEH